MPIHEDYIRLSKTPSDINEHLPTLYGIAMQCDHVTEIGVRTAVSATALVASSASKVVLIDIAISAAVHTLASKAATEGKDVEVIEKSSLEIDLHPTDFLHIDSLHTHDQLIAELRRHAPKVRRYMAFHDTHLFGLKDEPPHRGPGLLPALLTFLAESPEWRVHSHYMNNNGMTFLVRV